MFFHSITNFAEKGGAEMFLSRLCNSEAFSCSENKIVSICQVSNANKAMINSSNVVFDELGATSMLGMFRSAFKLAKVLKKDKPKVVFAWMYHAHVITTLAAVLAGYKGPVFWCVRHSLDDFKKESASTKLALILCRLLSGLSDGIIYCSQRAMFQHQKFGLSKKNNHFLANGYKIPVWQERSLPVIKRIGIAGRFHPAKNYPCFLAAAKLVAGKSENIVFHLCGRGVSLENPEFKALVDKLGLPLNRFRFMGEVNDMEQFYRDIDFFVLSSITEGFPNVLAEAMSFGVPAISTDVGDASYILGELGNVVPTENAKMLAKELTKLLAISNQNYRDLSMKCVGRIEKEFSIEKITQGYFNLMKEYV